MKLIDTVKILYGKELLAIYDFDEKLIIKGCADDVLANLKLEKEFSTKVDNECYKYNCNVINMAILEDGVYYQPYLSIWTDYSEEE